MNPNTVNKTNTTNEKNKTKTPLEFNRLFDSKRRILL